MIINTQLNIKPLLPPRLRGLLSCLNVRTYSMIEYCEMLDQDDPDIDYVYNSTLGVYDCVLDCIAVSVCQGDFARSILTTLHELAHWTGHPTRLNRKRFHDYFNRVSLSAETLKVDNDTEEMICDHAAVLLADKYGWVGDYERRSWLNQYSRHFPHADQVTLDTEVPRVIDYIVSRTAQS